MVHAILIMMHKSPEQVIRLVNCFPKDRCVCFLHLDKKSSVSFEEMQKVLRDNNCSCVLLERQLSGVLANWSLVEISLELLRAAKQYELKHQIHFDYYRLLSGQDYLIKPFEEYDRLLQQTYPMNYLGIEDIETSKHVKDKYARWRMPGPRQFIADRKLTGTVLGKLLVGITHIYELLLTRCKGTPREAVENHGWMPVGGPSWWTLSDQFVDYLLTDTKQQQTIKRIIRKTATPEESYVQLVYVASEQFCRTSEMYNLTIGKYDAYGHTAAWTKEEFELLMDSTCFFARKFDMEQDSEILDLLDNAIGKTT